MPSYGTQREIVEAAIAWLDGGHRVALVTVARTWGSSPRPVGSMLLMRPDGVHIGSVSGGCVEDDLLARFCNDEVAGSFPTLIDYGIDRGEATRLGLPCGGRLELVVEQLESPAPLDTLLQNLRSGELTARRVCLNTGETSLHPAVAGDDFDYSADTLTQVFGPRWRMLLIGAGHLAQYVARLALMLDYRVIICDPREEFRQGWAVDGAEFVRLMPDEAVQAYASHRRSVVVALTHDPKLDDMALLDALNSPAFYVGAIGSTQNSEQRRRRLEDLGMTPRQLQGLHAPVGLAIGSRTPPEIAVSIMAEITAMRHAARLQSREAATSA